MFLPREKTKKQMLLPRKKQKQKRYCRAKTKMLVMPHGVPCVSKHCFNCFNCFNRFNCLNFLFTCLFCVFSHLCVCVNTCHTTLNAVHLYCYCRAQQKNPIKRHGVPCISNVIAARIFHRPGRSVLQRCRKYSNVKKTVLYLVTLYSKCTRAQRPSTLPQILKSKRRKFNRQRPDSSTLTICLLSKDRGGFFFRVVCLLAGVCDHFALFRV
jgi:hypothetical protein